MRQREFMAGVGVAMIARPNAALAQQKSVPVVGFLGLARATWADRMWVRFVICVNSDTSR